MYILGKFASPGKRKEVATYEDDGDLPGPSFSFSPKKKTSVQTQTTEPSFSTVTNSTLCRICGEGRRETKAVWVGCSHVCNLGRVKQTCEYWVHALCIGITVTSKAPLSRIGWKYSILKEYSYAARQNPKRG